LKVDNSKTEQAEIFRGDGNTERWRTVYHVSEKLLLELFKTLVKSVLMYHNLTWGMTQEKIKDLDSLLKTEAEKKMSKYDLKAKFI